MKASETKKKKEKEKSERAKSGGFMKAREVN
jgi:hypothetical protein